MQRLNISISQRSNSPLSTTQDSGISGPQGVQRCKLKSQWIKVDGQLICQWSRSH